MSTPRVNLLPQDTAERQHAARERGAIGFALLGLVVLLGAVWLWQGTRLDDARAERDEAQARLAATQAEERELQEFAQLEERVERANQIVRENLAGEVSIAGVLQDLAAVVPTDTALTSLELTLMDQTGPDGELVRPAVARMSASGETLLGHAPGLERLLLQLDKVLAFFDVHFTTSALDEADEQVAIFSFEVDLGTEALTGRYLNGVPEELR